MMRALIVAASLVLAPSPVRAHPHAFIDGGLEFVFDGQGRLAALRVVWIYDPLTSLLMLEDLGIEEDRDLDPEDRRRLAAYQTEWEEGFEGDSYLWDGGRPVELSGPRAADAAIEEGRVVIHFLRSVRIPFRPGPDTVASVYDPTYFTAYAVTEPPRLVDAPNGCSARVRPFEPEAPLMALQKSLADLGVEEDPADPQVGGLFADRVFVTCR